MTIAERKNRESEEREVQEYKNNVMKNLRMGWKGELDIPAEEIPDGMDYRWVRHSVLGDSAKSRIAHMMSRGWTVVPPSRHPHIGNSDPFGENANSRQYIMIQGLMLMQRPKEFGEEEKRLDAEYQLSQMTANPALTSLMSDSRIPVQVWANQTMNSRSFRAE